MAKMDKFELVIEQLEERIAPSVIGDPHDPKCNAGGGNGSETLPENDCDPGNSGGNNNGKD